MHSTEPLGLVFLQPPGEDSVRLLQLLDFLSLLNFAHLGHKAAEEAVADLAQLLVLVSGRLLLRGGRATIA